MQNPFRYFNNSSEVIRFAVMLYVRYTLSWRQVEDLLVERGIDVCHEALVVPFGPVRSAVGRRDQAAADRPVQPVELAVAP